MVSPSTPNSWAGKKLFERWVGTSNTVGQAFKQTEREVKNHFDSGDDGFGSYWVAEYNLYGDPKFGQVASMGSLGTFAEAETPPAQIDISIPPVQVTSLEGYDQVWIPGGGFTMENDMPQLPTYVVTIPIPEGWQVWNVTLVSKGDASIFEGLNIPAVHVVYDTTVLLQKASEEGYPEGVFPEKEYSWELTEGNLGHQSLVIRICPAKYNMLTAQLQSWELYTFAINSSRSAAVIRDAQIASRTLALEETLRVETRIDLTDQDRIDVFLDGVIRSCTTGKVVGGVAIQNMHIAGPTYTTVSWEVENVTSGAYALDLHLTDKEGRPIDHESVRFWVGRCHVNVTSVAVEPVNAVINGLVTVSFAVSSGSDTETHGRAFAWLMDDLGRKVLESSCNVTIAPAGSTHIRQGFALEDLQEGRYWIAVYAALNSEPSEIRYVQINIAEGTWLVPLAAGFLLLFRRGKGKAFEAKAAMMLR